MINATCKNCGTTIQGLYCHQCGQAASTHRLGFGDLWHDFQHGLFHVDKGLLYTVKQLFSRPGHSIREYLQGKRVKHFRPFSLVIILSGIFGFLYHYFDVDVFKVVEKASLELEASRWQNFNKWVGTHFALLSILSIPIFALSSFIAFYKQGINFTEHLVLNAFTASQRLMIRILTFPVFLSLSESEHASFLTNVYAFLDFFLWLWTFRQFFISLRLWQALLQSVLAYFMYLAFMSGIILLIDWVYALWFHAH